MVNTIELVAVHGDERRKAILSYSEWGGGNYILTDGPIYGTFHPTDIWGWQYHGTPLEFDDIQYLINLIHQANANEEHNRIEMVSAVYDQHVVIPMELRRTIMTLQGKFEAIAAAPNYYKKSRRR